MRAVIGLVVVINTDVDKYMGGVIGNAECHET